METNYEKYMEDLWRLSIKILDYGEIEKDSRYIAVYQYLHSALNEAESQNLITHTTEDEQ